VFRELRSHYLFTDRFGRRPKATKKARSKGWSALRRNFMVPVPVFADFAGLNAHLLESYRKRMDDRLRGHEGQVIGDQFANDPKIFVLAPPLDAHVALEPISYRARWS
jgi:hypothetical protein